MAIFLAGLDEISFEDKVAHHLVGDERNVEGRTNDGLVLALLSEFERRDFIADGVAPGGGVADYEILESGRLIERLLVDQVVALRNARGNGTISGLQRACEDAHGHNCAQEERA